MKNKKTKWIIGGVSLLLAIIFIAQPFAITGITEGGRYGSYITYDKDVVTQGETLQAKLYSNRQIQCDYLSATMLDGEWQQKNAFTGTHCYLCSSGGCGPAVPSALSGQWSFLQRHNYWWVNTWGFPTGTGGVHSISGGVDTTNLVPGTHRLSAHKFDSHNFEESKLSGLTPDTIVEDYPYMRGAVTLDGKQGNNEIAYRDFVVLPKCTEIKEGEMYLERKFYAGETVSKQNMKYPVNSFDDCLPAIIIDAESRKPTSEYQIYYDMEDGKSTVVPTGQIWVIFAIIDIPTGLDIQCTSEEYLDTEVNSCKHITGIISLCEGGRLLPDGTCFHLTEEYCLSQGAKWDADLQTCAYDPCTQAGKGEYIDSYSSCGHIIPYSELCLDYNGKDITVDGKSVNSKGLCLQYLGLNMAVADIRCDGDLGTITLPNTDIEYYCLSETEYDCRTKYPGTNFALDDLDFPACAYGYIPDCNSVSYWNDDVGKCVDKEVGKVVEVRYEDNIIEKIVHDFTTEEVIPAWMWVLVAFFGIGFVALLVLRFRK